MNEKFTLYEEAGVREYWVVVPASESVLQFILQPDGKYDRGTKYETGEVPIHIFGGLTVDLKEVF
jgi:Uma2 family endonuclease